MSSADVLRIANCSGFYGDRFSAAREMVEGGEIDVLTGDYLAELTLMILHKDRLKDPALGYAKTFPLQLREIAATSLERGIKIVVNAGGLNPAGCAAACQKVYRALGLDAKVCRQCRDRGPSCFARSRSSGSGRSRASGGSGNVSRRASR